jgi:hypothetical protein
MSEVSGSGLVRSPLGRVRTERSRAAVYRARVVRVAAWRVRRGRERSRVVAAALVAAVWFVSVPVGAPPVSALDPTFGGPPVPGVVRLERSTLYQYDDVVLPLADGSVVVASASTIVKLTPAGAIDGTFDATGALHGCWASDLAVDAAGRIVVAIGDGCIPAPAFVRLEADGSLDVTADPSGSGSSFGTRIVSVDGAIVLAGRGADGACLS